MPSPKNPKERVRLFDKKLKPWGEYAVELDRNGLRPHVVVIANAEGNGGHRYFVSHLGRLSAPPSPPRDEEAWPFDWKPTDAENFAVKLSIAMHKHVPGWGGATDEQLDAIAKDMLATDLASYREVSGNTMIHL